MIANQAKNKQLEVDANDNTRRRHPSFRMVGMFGDQTDQTRFTGREAGSRYNGQTFNGKDRRRRRNISHSDSTASKGRRESEADV